MTREEALMVGKAFVIATVAHGETINKDGTVYTLHPVRLAMQCDVADEQIVALLHDTVEDTPLTIEDLAEQGFPGHILEAIDALTKREDETGDDGYGRAIERVAANPLATRIKLLDLEDNINVLRLDEVGDWELKRTAKYHRAWKRLRAVQQERAA